MMNHWRKAVVQWAWAFIFVISLDGALGAKDNMVFNPCNTSQPVKKGDGFSFGIQFGENVNTWGAVSSSGGSGISPCDPALIPYLPSGVQYAVFRPRVDELTLLRINNESLAGIERSFPSGNISLIAFAGWTPQPVVSPPRQFKTSTALVPSFTLVLVFEKGVHKGFLWKSEGCRGCASDATRCFNERDDCAIGKDECVAAKDSGNKEPCRLGINVAFTGTDKHGVVLKSWFNVEQISRYSLTKVYDNAANSFSDALGSAEDSLSNV